MPRGSDALRSRMRAGALGLGGARASLSIAFGDAEAQATGVRNAAIISPSAGALDAPVTWVG